MSTRSSIVHAARSWLGTPYQHQARLRGVGVDCIGLVIGVARSLGLVAPEFDINGYSRQPAPAILMAACEKHMQPVPLTRIQAGDVIVTRFERDPCHFAIVADYYHGGHLSMIHAANRAGGKGGVIEHRLDPINRARIHAAFALPGVA